VVILLHSLSRRFLIVSDTQTNSPKHRSPSYPAFDLQTAISKARLVYNNQKRHPAPVDVAKKTLGYEPKSSNALRAIATLISYGLLEEEGSAVTRKVKLTELGLKILLLQPEDNPERIAAIQDAALTPVIYKDMMQYWEGDLPDNTVIENYLTFTKHFNETVVKSLIKDFRATYEFANLNLHGILSPEESDSGNEACPPAMPPLKAWPSPPVAALKLPEPASVPPQPQVKGTTPVIPDQSEMRTFTLPLYDGKGAILQAPLNLSQEDVELLEESFQTIKKTLLARPKPPLPVRAQQIPFVAPGRALWRTQDGDHPITVTGYAGEQNGRHYVNIEGSETGLPIDELVSGSDTN